MARDRRRRNDVAVRIGAAVRLPPRRLPRVVAPVRRSRRRAATGSLRLCRHGPFFCNATTRRCACRQRPPRRRPHRQGRDGTNTPPPPPPLLSYPWRPILVAARRRSRPSTTASRHPPPGGGRLQRRRRSAAVPVVPRAVRPTTAGDAGLHWLRG
ncbi:hypothetical protein BU14_0082s0060 [Porphyra umbilicalis]|uniref:Uncharacterized protein n=1 Tax=Porphyra umbilicalis TaxID=2786 RepID=A0A1X6PEW5_PORUM|nr:hypothetical protein BU14_0082s0060 [Porphyra umbilicalis]|eukprot:OSX79295.1 hypothetical protein BU14_0082s0060 [Porphyra umbilicalis]